MDRLLLIMLPFLILSCQDSTYDIRTSKYKVSRAPFTIINEKPLQLLDIKGITLSQFHSDTIQPAPSYYGGLSPKYPMARAMFYGDLPDNNLLIYGGLIITGENLLMKVDTGVLFINSKELVDKYFLPIENKSEALSYAALLTESYPIYDFSFLNRNFEFDKKVLNKTHVDSVDHKFIVHLFEYKAFGCTHPYLENTYEVSKDGQIKLLKQEQVFRDTKEDGLCVD